MGNSLFIIKRGNTMDDKDNIVDGFSFQSSKEREVGKKEYEAIQKLKKKIDINDPDEMLEMYTKMVVKRYFVTPVGISFLKDMRDYLVSNCKDKTVPPVHIPEKNVSIKTTPSLFAGKIDKLEKENSRLLRLKQKLVVAVVTLTIVIVAMVFMVVTNKNLGYFNAEEKVLDKYSAWEERLSTWEEELILREEKLRGREQDNSTN